MRALPTTLAISINLDAVGRDQFPQKSGAQPRPELFHEGDKAPMATRPSFYILDAFSLIFQVFHAIPET